MRASASAGMLAVASMVLSGCSHDGGLSEQSVQEAVTGFEMAVSQGHIEEAASFLSSDCVVHRATDSLTCREMVEEENKSRLKGADGRIDSTTPVITINNGKAHARTTVTIILTAYGKTWKAISNQDDTIESQGGRLAVTRIDETQMHATADGHDVQ